MSTIIAQPGRPRTRTRNRTPTRPRGSAGTASRGPPPRTWSRRWRS